MLNQYSYKAGSTNTQINAVSGTLVKNHPKSFFERFGLRSIYGERVLNKKPHIIEGWKDKEVPVIVLQVMIVGNMEVLAEIVREADYGMKGADE